MIDPDIILAWKVNYGLLSRTPEKAAAWWHDNMNGKAPAGAVAALGLALEEIERLEAKLAALVEAANEIACSPVEFDDARIEYITMQVDRKALEELKAAIAAAKGTP